MAPAGGPPGQLLLLGAAAFAAGRLLARAGRGPRAEDGGIRARTGPQRPRPPAAVAVVSPPPLPPADCADCGADEARRQRVAGAAVFALSGLLVALAAALSAHRGHWDVVAATLLAWLPAAGVLAQQRSRAVDGGGGGADASLRVEIEDAPPGPVALPDIAGTWVKDNAASDSMEVAMRLMRLNGVVRTAVKLIRGVAVELDEQRFQFGVFSVVGWFKITERYWLDGQHVSFRRRDLRRGKASGVARVTPWGTVRLEYEWGEPHAGRGVDEFSLGEDGLLRIACTITAASGEGASYTQVFRRKA